MCNCYRSPYTVMKYGVLTTRHGLWSAWYVALFVYWLNYAFVGEGDAMVHPSE